MDNLIVIIPAKTSSTRVPNKNFCPFYKDKSLVDILIEKLIKTGISARNIYLSCDDKSKVSFCDTYGISFHLREKRLCHNETPFSEVFKITASEVCKDNWASDIVWAQACDPLFDDYENCFNLWNKYEKDFDSLVVRYKQKRYLMDQNGVPIGWGFGPWHIPSQRLPIVYEMPFTLSILKRETIEEYGYWVGANPLWVDNSNFFIDIDTLEEFESAQAIYAARKL